jgi:hypothetical protein
MKMIINQPRQNAAAPQIYGPRFLTGKWNDISLAADGNEFTVPNGDGISNRIGRVKGGKFSSMED